MQSKKTIEIVREIIEKRKKLFKKLADEHRYLGK